MSIRGSSRSRRPEGSIGGLFLLAPKGAKVFLWETIVLRALGMPCSRQALRILPSVLQSSGGCFEPIDALLKLPCLFLPCRFFNHLSFHIYKDSHLPHAFSKRCPFDEVAPLSQRRLPEMREMLAFAPGERPPSRCGRSPLDLYFYQGLRRKPRRKRRRPKRKKRPIAGPEPLHMPIHNSDIADILTTSRTCSK